MDGANFEVCKMAGGWGGLSDTDIDDPRVGRSVRATAGANPFASSGAPTLAKADGSPQRRGTRNLRLIAGKHEVAASPPRLALQGVATATPPRA